MATRVDLKGMKDAVKSILEAANTTTASPIDLSSDLEDRVQQVMTVHPERIRPQSSIFPLVTCFVESKPIKSNDIASNQLLSKRRATVNLVVVGAVWNNVFTDFDEDPADEDINYLMENVELILRSNHTLNSACRWQVASDVKYYTSFIGEQTCLRSGMLRLDCEVFY